MKPALLAIDTQNDFFASDGICAANGDDVSRLERVIVNLGTAVNNARDNNIEIIWIQYLGDDKYKTPNLKERDKKRGKMSKCLKNTWGAEFYQVTPDKNERIFRKYACFDPFINPKFETYLNQREITHLLLAGIYTDVCLDSTARSGFQKGYYISVLGDCTESLYYAKTDVLGFVKKFYDAKIVTSDTFMK